MPLNILLLPILGGYYFLSNHYYYKFKLQRLSSQKLLFDSVLIGILFSFTSFITITIFNFLFVGLSDKIAFYLAINEDYFAVGILSFLLGILFSHSLNYFTTEEESLKKAIKKWGDELDQLFMTALLNKEQLMISLQNGKIYIGFVVELSQPGKTKYYSILPTLSGYRTTKKHNVKITTNYFDVFDSNENFEPSLTYINASSILSVKPFVTEIFEEFKK